MPFFVFIVLLLLTIPFSFGKASSVVPRWHAAVLAPLSSMVVIVTIALCLVAVAYWMASEGIARISWPVFITHLLLTLPTVLLIRCPLLFSNVDATGLNTTMQTINLESQNIRVAYALFITAQILFAFYFFKNNRTIVQALQNYGQQYV